VAVTIAVAVNTDGRSEGLGPAVGLSEAEVFWTGFPPSLTRRGLRGVTLVISNSHDGIKAAGATPWRLAPRGPYPLRHATAALESPMWSLKSAPSMIAPERALPGRPTPMALPEPHFVNGTSLEPPFPAGLEIAVFGMGCFWGAERRYWSLPGVVTTAVGYAGGYTPNPTYEEVCSGRNGHAEVVRVVFDPTLIGYRDLLTVFWESHDPTQGMRQGNDVGTQYRSCIHTHAPAQHELATASRHRYDRALGKAGHEPVTTEIIPAPAFYYAEGYHQQYLARNPAGYCGLGGTGIVCPAA